MAYKWKKVGGLMLKKAKVKGYDVLLKKTPSGTMTLSVPLGKTEREKQIFDDFVYYNQKLYHGKNEKQLKENLSKFLQRHGR